jgi:HPt (histidine-containing phosphotransfer) domain-containing protein
MAHIMKPILEHPLREVLTRTTGDAALETPQPPPSIPEGVFDQQAMLERLMGDQDLIGTVIEVFLDDIPQQLSDLLRMISAGDVAGTERLAHSIRGASGTLAAERFSETAHKIELEARGGEIGRAAAHVPELEARLAELTSALARSGLVSRERL